MTVTAIGLFTTAYLQWVRGSEGTDL
nr:cytochrome b6/f complex subunit 5 [Trentepohlia sp. YN1317]